MPYPMNKWPTLEEFGKMLKEHNVTWREVETFSVDGGEEIVPARVVCFERVIGGRTLRAVVDPKPDPESDQPLTLCPDSIRSYCARLQLNPSDCVPGFGLD